MTELRVLWATALFVALSAVAAPCAFAEDEFPEPDPPPEETKDDTKSDGAKGDGEKANEGNDGDVPGTPEIEEPAAAEPPTEKPVANPAKKDLPPPTIRNPARSPRIIPAPTTPTVAPTRTAPIRQRGTNITSRPVTAVPMQPVVRTRPGATLPATTTRVPYVAPGAPRAPRTPTTIRRPVSPTGPVRPTREIRVSNIDRISKRHNLKMRSGATGMRVDITFTAINQANRSLYVGIWFARKDDEKLIRSSWRNFADSAGNLTVQTRPVRVSGKMSTYKSSVMVPYGAFPAPGAGESYDIEARVQLLRREGARVRVLARTVTTFTVHGPEASDAP